MVCPQFFLNGFPEWTFFGALRAGVPVDTGEWIGSLIYTQEDGTFNNINRSLSTTNSGVKDAQLSVGFRSEDNWSVKAYVENLTDEDSYDSLVGSNTFDGASNYAVTGVNAARPRTIGVRFGYEF